MSCRIVNIDTRLIRLGLALGLLLRASGSHAQDMPGDDSCVTSASPEDKERARALTDRAHALNLDFRFEEAARVYIEVIERWDHPSYRLALGLALYNSAKLLESEEHFRHAVRCGRGLLGEQQLAEANARIQRLHQQLATVEIHVEHPGAEVLLDGEPLPAGARSRRLAYPGHHVLRVLQPGYVEQAIEFDVGAGERARVVPRLLRLDEAIVYERRLASWKPWAVAGGSVAVALVGAGLRAYADKRASDYEQALKRQCEARCMVASDGPIADHWQDAQTANRAAVVAFGIGGVGLAAGLTLVLLNQPRARRRDNNQSEIRIVPRVDSERTSLSITGRF